MFGVYLKLQKRRASLSDKNKTKNKKVIGCDDVLDSGIWNVTIEKSCVGSGVH